MAVPSDAGVTAIVLICVLIGFLVAIYYSFQTAKVLLRPASEPLMSHQQESSGDAQESKVETIATIVDAIAEGAHAFLMREYTYLAVFIAVFSVVVFVAVGTAPDSTWSSAALATVCACVRLCLCLCRCGLVGGRSGG
jgi:Na+/H+-translocating membrane pyrophosphatase